MKEVFTTVLGTALIGLAGFLGTQFKRIYERFTADKTKKAVAETVVKAVEQIYKDLHGDEKKQKAIKGIRDMVNEKGIPISDIEIEMYIEAAVAEFNAQRKKDVK
ncbi:MAG: phage holin [Clostridiales bacterium]|nr:phage holin [Clostridiales bacterium]